jgi:hypothetical protein
MPKDNSCTICAQNKRLGKPLVSFRDKHTTCFICHKKVDCVLDLHHTDADICSLKCERQYWIDATF